VMIVGLKDNQLIVNVDSSAWVYHFNLKKNKILQNIQKEFPEIKRIYFKVGKTNDQIEDESKKKS